MQKKKKRKYIKKHKKHSKNKDFDVFLPSNKIIKVKLSRIIRPQFLDKINNINNIVNRMNQIIIHTYKFLKLFCIHHFFKYKNLPEINKNLIMMIIKTVSES